MRLKKDKSGDTVGRPSWRSSLPGDPGAKFFCGKPQHMKNSLNFANTCLKVVDTRRILGGQACGKWEKKNLSSLEICSGAPCESSSLETSSSSKTPTEWAEIGRSCRPLVNNPKSGMGTRLLV